MKSAVSVIILTMQVDTLTMQVDALTMQVDALTMQIDTLTMQVDAPYPGLWFNQSRCKIITSNVKNYKK